MTLLVLEDEALTRCLISDELRARGYKVVETASVEEARVVMATLRLDLAFLDIHVPGGASGLELAAWIRTHHPATKLILTSGKVDPSSLPDLSGVGPFLAKPYPFSRVVELVARCLEPPGDRRSDRERPCPDWPGGSERRTPQALPWNQPKILAVVGG